MSIILVESNMWNFDLIKYFRQIEYAAVRTVLSFTGMHCLNLGVSDIFIFTVRILFDNEKY